MTAAKTIAVVTHAELKSSDDGPVMIVTVRRLGHRALTIGKPRPTHFPDDMRKGLIAWAAEVQS